MSEESKQRQRKVQALVRDLRQSGADASTVKKEVENLKRKLAPPSKRSMRKRQNTERRGNMWQQRKEVADRHNLTDETMKLVKKHQLVVIPIFWKKREEEMEEVIQAAKDFKQKMVKYKINVWVDRRKGLTPSQKFEYWEQVGCKFRVEIGPKESREKTVVLGKVGAGNQMKSSGKVRETRDVAKRWHNLKSDKPEDIYEIAKLLKEEGLTYINLDAFDDDAPEEKVPETNNDEQVEEAEATPSGDSLDVGYVIEQ